MSVVGVSIPPETVAIGALSGLSYAVLGVGLVLVYRSTRVINFAHGEIGAFSAAILAELVIDHHWNFFAALLVAAAVGAGVGFVVEALVIRRFFTSPRLVVLVATIGVSQLLFFAQAALPGVSRVTPFPSGVEWRTEIGSLVLRGEHFMVILVVPALVVALTVFLRRTPFGLAIRASTDNMDAAQLAGVRVRRVSSVVWVLAGVLAAVSVVLINPIRGTIVGLPSVALGPDLLLRALVAALVGRMVSLPLTLAGGVVLGSLEAVALVNFTSPGTMDLILLVLVIGLVALRGVPGGDHETADLDLSAAVSSPARRPRVPGWLGRLPVVVPLLAIVAAVLLPLVVVSPSSQFLFSRVALFAVVGISVVVVTGWAGQLSLCQFAFVGLGSMVTAGLQARGMPFGLGVVYGTVAGAVAAVLVGAPALRVRGIFLGATTLGFAVAARGWLLQHDIFLGRESAAFVPRGRLGPFDLSDQRTYYYLCLVVLLVAGAMVGRWRRTGAGRALIGARDNEAAAAAFTISPTVARLGAFALSGALAALAGGLLAGLRVQFGAADFGPDESLRIVAMVIIGGVTSVWGAVLGAVYVLGLPALIQDSLEVRLLTSGAGLLVVLMLVPGGLADVVRRLHVGVLDRLRPADTGPAVEPAFEGDSGPPIVAADVEAFGVREPAGRARSNGQRRRPLEVEDVVVRFGGLTALGGVSLHVEPGEIVGLIGTNGAGKSTLMNVVSGFVKPSDGIVRVFDEDVTRSPAHRRSRLGVGRVFQDAGLFGGLTVRETVSLALEALDRSEFVPSLLALPPSRRSEAAKRARADQVIERVGLVPYADVPIAHLSTGTRRVVELACLMAREARLLLLDEPTAGVAQREVEAFGTVIRRVRDDLDAAVVLIEHDIPLVMDLADRVYCFSAGTLIAEGRPLDVRRDPVVVASYLGTDERAIARSGTIPSAVSEGSRRA